MRRKAMSLRCKIHLRARAKGQSLAIIGIILATGVLIGLVAIAFDGGSALLQRRTMQNGADAGVLAGGDFLSRNLAASCNPAPCHPTYLVTNQELRTQVDALVSANRGGTVGAATSDYTTILEYHYMTGHVPSTNCPNPGHDLGYCPAPPNPTYFVPEFVDGLRVTAGINNPTVFARAIPNPLADLKVSAVAAVRLYPTCAPEPNPQDSPMPFTRFRAALEHEMTSASGGNSLCHPFEFWKPGNDAGLSGWKDVISFNAGTFHPYTGAPAGEQLLIAKDPRNGPEDPMNPWPNSGLNDYDKNNIPQTLQHCASSNCADLRGSGANGGNLATQDFQNWIFWQWRGRISITNTWGIETNTRYPSTTANQGGQTGSLTVRPGDWAEIDYTGNLGDNIQRAVYHLANTWGVMTSVGRPVAQGGLNWGNVITRTVYVWGEPESQLPSSMSSQIFGSYTTPCSPPSPGCTVNHPAWLDVRVSGTYPSYTTTADVGRVRFTKFYTFLFFSNLQGNLGAVTAPGCNTSLPNSGSSAWGILPSIVVPPPSPGGSCSTEWIPGGGVYKLQIDPNGP